MFFCVIPDAHFGGKDWPSVGRALKGPPPQRSGWDRAVGRGLSWSLFPQLQDSCAVLVISVHAQRKGLQRHVSPSPTFNDEWRDISDIKKSMFLFSLA